VDEQGQAIEIRDPLKDQLANIVANSEDGAPRVKALLGLNAVFGDDLQQQPVFVSRVTELYLQLVQQGARATVQSLVTQG
jgi:fructuronate reductase